MTLLLLFGGTGSPAVVTPIPARGFSTSGGKATLDTRGGENTLNTKGPNG